MNTNEVLAGLGGLLILGALAILGAAIAGIFILGTAWASLDFSRPPALQAHGRPANRCLC